MPVRGNVFHQGNYYHIYNRGKKLFSSTQQYMYCISLFQKYAKKFEINLLAYCLMPNHYHLLVKQEGDITISKWIGVVFNQYAQKINRQRNDRGAIFESRFKHILVDKEEYLLALSRYIHLNPVKAKLVSQPEEWLASDYVNWISGTNEILEVYFGGINNYAGFVTGNLEKQIPNRYMLSID